MPADDVHNAAPCRDKFWLAKPLIGSAILIATAAPLYAQDAPVAAQDAPAAAQDEQSEPAQAEDIIVTARKREENLLDVPVALQVFGQEDVERYASSNLSDVASMATQVNLITRGDGAGAAFSVRGIASSSGDVGVDSSVAINIDGAQITRGRIINQGFFDVGSVQVLKGPQVLFFGKNSPAGVIAIQTAQPTANWEFSGRAYYEFNAEEFIGEAIASGPLSDTLGIRVGYQGTTSSGWMKNSATPQPVQAALPLEPYAFPGKLESTLGGEESHLGRVVLNYEPTSDFSANLNITGATEVLESSGSLKELVSCSGSRPRAAGGLIDPSGDCTLNGVTSAGALPRELQQAYQGIEHLPNGSGHNTFDSLFGILNLEYDTGSLNIASTTSVAYYKWFRWDNFDGTVYNQQGGNDLEKYRQISQEIRLLTEFDGAFNFLLGGFFEDARLTTNPGFKFAAVGPDPVTGFTNSATQVVARDTNSLAGFGQVIITPTDKLELTGGVRVTRDTLNGEIGFTYVHSFLTGLFLPVGTRLTPQLTNTNVSPEFTARYKITDRTSIYAAYKTGYKAGGMSAVAIVAPTQTADSLLYEPETVDGAELGFRGEFLDRRLRVAATAYRYNFNNMQDTVYIASTVSYVIRNSDARTTGADLELDFAVNEALSLRGQIAYNDAQYRSYTDSPCYAGQTVAEGCVGGAQDLSGRPRPVAPEWEGGFGFTYATPINDSIRVTATADVRYSDGYHTQPTLNPFAFQSSFALVNASLKFGDVDERWEFALIGRNLTNKRYFSSSIDQPGGIRGDILADAIRPRQIALQTKFKF